MRVLLLRTRTAIRHRALLGKDDQKDLHALAAAAPYTGGSPREGKNISSGQD